MSEEKIALTFGDGEDSTDILTPKGKVLCTIYRDDDSMEAASKVIKALGFKCVWEDGSEVEL